MARQALKARLEGKGGFLVLAELVGGPGFNVGPIRRFLRDARQQGQAAIPQGFVLAGIALPQNPGGVANLEPPDVVRQLTAEGLIDDLDVVAHLTCKDHNVTGMVSALSSCRSAGVESLLVLTGDKPVSAKGVFELESVTALQLIRRINNENLLKADPSKLAGVHQFFPGAAVSPFKYSEPSLVQQYYKMEKKIACGARFLITQVGWDWRKSKELFQVLSERKLNIPVLGNVYLLSTLTAAPRLMHDGKLTGCFVSDELLAKVYSEGVDEHVERAGQQVAMYKALGAAGVDVAGVPDFGTFARILQRASQIGEDWHRYQDNLSWPAKDGFYLYDDSGRPTGQCDPDKTLGQRFFNFSHRAFLDPRYRGFRAFKKTLAFFGADRPESGLYKTFNAGEKGFKYLLFECQECGDCFLPENFGLCTLGGCEKGLANAPCGDATVDGRCGNNTDRLCIGHRIYLAAAAEKDGRQRLRARINRPRNPALEHSSSIVNYLFGRDHTMKTALIGIGESIHASIPRVGAVMKELEDRGEAAYSEPNPSLSYIQALVESQADDAADYIAVNVDAFGEDDPAKAVRMMRQYVRLVRQWGKGVPVCVDSGNDDTLIAGLEEWYSTPDPVRPPLINSVKTYTMERILPLKKEYDFSVIALLVSEQTPTGPGGSYSVDQLMELSHTLFDTATAKYGLRPDQIFFDSTVFPLAIDMPMEPGVPGYTYRAFETIRRIRATPKFKGVHCSLGISNSVRDLPGRKIGVCRAYVAKAMEYGLDAGIVNVGHHYGTVEPSAELMDLVDAYAQMDGSPEKTTVAMERMAQFCRQTRKAS
jgi:methylenetetrahydrofolate reductase (NADPH)